VLELRGVIDTHVGRAAPGREPGSRSGRVRAMDCPGGSPVSRLAPLPCLCALAARSCALCRCAAVPRFHLSCSRPFPNFAATAALGGWGGAFVPSSGLGVRFYRGGQALVTPWRAWCSTATTPLAAQAGRVLLRFGTAAPPRVIGGRGRLTAGVTSLAARTQL